MILDNKIAKKPDDITLPVRIILQILNIHSSI